jgi:formylglycine-generating enzyme required for sulfatase activity
MRDTVFVSYCHKDKKWLQEFMPQLKVFEGEMRMKLWVDTEIRTGAQWLDDIEAALSSARVAVLLVTADYLASDFVAVKEIPAILQAQQKDGLAIAWVAVSACTYSATSINKFQAANDPRRPLDIMARPRRQEKWAEIAKKVHDLYCDGGDASAQPAVPSEVDTANATPAGGVPQDNRHLERSSDALPRKPNGSFNEPAPVAKEVGMAIPVAASPRPAVEAPTPAPGAVRRNPIDGLEYVWIPPGSFRMGWSDGDEENFSDELPTHNVEITGGFWIGKTPVTQAAYEKVMKTNPSRFKGAERPVECVSWTQALAYCRAVGLRLPTEAEWEYAARAGSKEARFSALDQVAWYADNSAGQTHAVALKQANAWGLHDVLGNVWEWCSDWYDSYRAGVQKDPTGPESGNQRVLRGGSFYVGSEYIRVSCRSQYGPSNRNSDTGFRCVYLGL